MQVRSKARCIMQFAIQRHGSAYRRRLQRNKPKGGVLIQSYRLQTLKTCPIFGMLVLGLNFVIKTRELTGIQEPVSMNRCES